jgi:hypothetical protein
MSQLTMQLRIDASGANVPTIVRKDCANAAERIEALEACLQGWLNMFGSSNKISLNTRELLAAPAKGAVE